MTKAAKKILIVDDEEDIRRLIRGILEDEGYEMYEAGTAKRAYETVENSKPDLIILDIWLQGSEQDGMDILSTLKKTYANLPIIMISGHGTIETAVNSIKKGAYDFIEKPFKSDRLLLMIKRALETAALRHENQRLKDKTKSLQKDELIGSSEKMQSLRDVITRVAPTDSRVLLTGEAGTGKNMLAHMIYEYSARADQNFVVLNCAMLGADSFETELFGQEKPHVIKGALEKANGGTVFLDDVSDLALETQAKLVRVLQDQSFHRVGGEKIIAVDVRVLAASNKDLETEIAEGRFREDLYYRLKVVPLHIPALDTHKEDIPELCTYFLSKFETAAKAGKALKFSKEALETLKNYKWPGNVRQLRNMIEWILIIHGDTIEGTIKRIHLPPEIHKGAGSERGADGSLSKTMLAASEQDNAGVLLTDSLDMSLRDARENFEKAYLQNQIERFEGNVSKMSEFVGMERSALHRKLKSLNISTDVSSGDEPSKQPPVKGTA